MNDIAGYQRFDNYSLSDGISGIASDGRTIEFKLSNPQKVISKIESALQKADIAVIVINSINGLWKYKKTSLKNNGEIILINSSKIDEIEIMQKNNLSDWREVRSDSKSLLRTNNSIPILSIIQELQKVKPENQDPMDYEIYRKAFI